MSEAAIQRLERRTNIDDLGIFEELRKSGYTLIAHDSKHFEWLMPDEGGGSGLMEEEEVAAHARKLHAALKRNGGNEANMTVEMSRLSQSSSSTSPETNAENVPNIRKNVSPNELRRDGGTQPRAVLSQAVIDEYAEAMERGDIFPPVIAFSDGIDLWLASGFHRQAAAIKADKLLDVEVRKGTVRDAILFSVGENATHGLRRSNADKHRAVETILADAEWSKWSDNRIANHCGVSQRFVGEARLSMNGSKIGETRIVERGGKTYEMATANIGRKRKAGPATEPVGATSDEQEPFDIEQAMEDLPGPEVTEPTEEELNDDYALDYESIEVEAARLESGGDIIESYSADLIGDYKGNSRVRKPFIYDGKQYISTGGVSGGGDRTEAEAYQLVPAEDFTGETVGYNDIDADKARRNPLGFYHGMRVAWKKKPYVLQGPELHFIAELKDDIPPSSEEPKPATPPQNPPIFYSLPELLDLAEEYQKGEAQICVSGFLDWLRKRELVA